MASGTATVEAAIMGTPFVMVYRVSPLTYALGKPRVKVPYFAMVNLIAEQEVVPELVQHKFTAENIVAEMNQIIPDGAPRTRMIERLAEVKARLKIRERRRAAASLRNGGGDHPRNDEMIPLTQLYGAGHSSTGHDGACVRMLRIPFFMWIGTMTAGYAHQSFRITLSPGSQECGFLSS